MHHETPGDGLPTTADRIRSALWFSGQGFAIFTVWSPHPDGSCKCPPGSSTRVDGGPCTSPGKHPITPQGFKDATRDPDRIRTLLSAGSAPNYGLVCPDGVLALDIDGDGWVDRLAEVEAIYGPMPDTLTTSTPHGLHVFMRWPDDLPRPLGPLFGWVTRWGTGARAGYVIGPGSMHASGQPYRLLDGPQGPPTLTVASVPTRWASAALGPSTGRTDGVAADGPTITVDGGYVLPDNVPEGGRYEAIVSYTAHLYNRGIEGDDAWAMVWARLAPRFAVPLSRDELRARFNRAVHGMAERLGAPQSVHDDDGGVAQGGRSRAGSDDMLLLDEQSAAFPDPPADAAYGGLLGELVDVLAVDTDAARVGLLGSVLAYAGVALPRRSEWHGNHTSSPYICLVGNSAVGRKGTAMTRAYDGWYEVVPGAIGPLPLTGLQSGESIVAALDKSRQHVLVEEEYARLLTLNRREGTTVDAMLRTAFDGRQLAQRKADGGKVVQPPYWLSALVAITPDELRSMITSDAALTGSANRWAFLPVHRRDVHARGHAPVIPLDMRKALLSAQQQAVGQQSVPLPVDDDVRDALTGYGDHLQLTTVGLTARLVARLPVMALRLAMVHASADRAASVTSVHLERALALTEYARRGLAWVFGPVLGSPDTRTVYRMLHDPDRADTGLSWEVMRGRLRHADKVQAAVDELQQLGLARIERTTQPRGSGVPTGRPRRILWPTDVRVGDVADYRGTHRPNRGDYGPNGPPRARYPGDDTGPTVSTVRGDDAQPDDTVRATVSGPFGDGLGTDRPSDEYMPLYRADGTRYCTDYRAHQHRLRDVLGLQWCEVCSPELQGKE